MKLVKNSDQEWHTLTSFLEASNFSAVICDARAANYPIIFANSTFERVTGYSTVEVLGKNCRFLQSNDRDQDARLQISMSIAKDEGGEYLLRNYRKSGQMFWNKLYIFPLRKEGNINYLVGIQHDVSRENFLLDTVQKTAAERARLIEVLCTERSRMARLSLDLVNAQEAERKALARELHDEFGQRLCALKMLLDRSKPHAQTSKAQSLWSQAENELTELIGFVRNTATTLRPPQLDYFGLEPAIYDLLERQLKDGPTWVFECLGLPTRLDSDIEISIFRITQESVTNILRHARANHIVVEISCDGTGKQLNLTISDDGCGFDSSGWQESSARTTKMGLTGMRERVALLGGIFRVNSTPGSGTVVSATLPFKSDLG